MTEVMLASQAVNLFNLAISATAFALLLRWILSVLGFAHKETNDKLDDNPVAIAILYAGLSLGLAIIISGAVR